MPCANSFFSLSLARAHQRRGAHKSHACRPARRVHARQSGAHFAGLLGPRHPRRPRPWHRPCGTFFRQQTCHPRRPVPPKFLGPRAPRPFCAFPQVVSQDGEKSAKTSAPPQRSVRAGTAGGIRTWQVPWMRSALSCSRRLLGLGVLGLTPPGPCAIARPPDGPRVSESRP